MHHPLHHPMSHIVSLSAPLDTSKYERGLSRQQRKARYTKDKKLNAGLKKVDRLYKDAVKSAASTELLLQEEAGFLEAEGMEKTFKFKQADIATAVDAATAAKQFELKLDEYGPYTLNYTRNGRGLLIAGAGGHVALVDWRTGALDCELHLAETCHAIQLLHNDQYFAVAQKKYTFIYDKTGLELHRLKQHIEATRLSFLPYHFLLATAGNTGYLKYHDVLTGVLVSEHRTKLGPTQAMKQNPWNAVMHLGHGNGTVLLWAPNMPQPLAKLQLQRGPVRDVAIDREGKYMAVAGADKQLKLWDLRKLAVVDTYYTPTPAALLDISDTGLLLVGWGPHVTVWKDVFKQRQLAPYMNHLIAGSKCQTVQFVPFEDVLGIGHQRGVLSIVVPGAAEANFDALELNPYESAKQRQEQEVRLLLNKLSPDTILLDPNVIGTVDKRASAVRLKPGQIDDVAATDAKMEPRPDVKAQNSKLRTHLRKKKQNVIDQRKLRIEKNLKMEKELRQKRHRAFKGIPEEKDLLGPALSRFQS